MFKIGDTVSQENRRGVVTEVLDHSLVAVTWNYEDNLRILTSDQRVTQVWTEQLRRGEHTTIDESVPPPPPVADVIPKPWSRRGKYQYISWWVKNEVVQTTIVFWSPPFDEWMLQRDEEDTNYLGKDSMTAMIIANKIMTSDGYTPYPNDKSVPPKANAIRWIHYEPELRYRAYIQEKATGKLAVADLVSRDGKWWDLKVNTDVKVSGVDGSDRPGCKSLTEWASDWLVSHGYEGR